MIAYCFFLVCPIWRQQSRWRLVFRYFFKTLAHSKESEKMKNDSRCTSKQFIRNYYVVFDVAVLMLNQPNTNSQPAITNHGKKIHFQYIHYYMCIGKIHQCWCKERLSDNYEIMNIHWRLGMKTKRQLGKSLVLLPRCELSHNCSTRFFSPTFRSLFPSLWCSQRKVARTKCIIVRSEFELNVPNFLQ